MTPPYRFRDVRQETIFRRLRLLGEGPAQLYRDACRLMEEPDSFETTSHLVNHLLREVESAVRAVLQTQDEGVASQGASTERHRSSILAVLTALGIDESTPIAQLWLQLPGDQGLDKRAHRNALFQPRNVVSEFLEHWDRVQTILDFVLERFEERCLDYHRSLDELAMLQTPTRADARRLKQKVPNNLVAYRHFFEKISSVGRLRPLNEEGLFSHPPVPETQGELIQFPSWPQSQYLIRMAPHDPREVSDIISAMPPTENIAVLPDLTEALSEMPAVEAVRLVDKVRSWIRTPYLATMLLPDVLGRLAAHFAKGGHTDEALALARDLLAVKPSSAGTQVTEIYQYLRTRPEGHLRNWDYNELLRLRVPILVKEAGISSVRLLCDLLDNAVNINRGPQEEGSRDEKDFSRLWRSDLEEDVRESGNEILNPLVTSVRDAVEQVIGDEPSLLCEIIDILEGHGWTIFRRLSLHALRTFKSEAPALVHSHLADGDLAQDWELERQYVLLLADAFPSLRRESQNEILQMITEGPDPEMPQEEFDKDTYVRRWQWQRPSPVRDFLSNGLGRSR